MPFEKVGESGTIAGQDVTIFDGRQVNGLYFGVREGDHERSFARTPQMAKFLLEEKFGQRFVRSKQM